MESGKGELKRIETKRKRQVAFSKRKGGLLKKGKELATLCDVDVGIIVFSAGGKLFTYSNGDSLMGVVGRYLDYKATKNILHENTASDVLKVVSRHLDESTVKMLNMPQLAQFQRQLDSLLVMTTTRKQVQQRNAEMQKQILSSTEEKGTPNKAFRDIPDLNEPISL